MRERAGSCSWPELRAELEERFATGARSGEPRVTTEELLSLLREHGIADVSQVGRAWLEDDGKLSVVSIRQ